MPTDRRATYRIQVHAGFTLSDAAAQVDYLGRLGISHLYPSPILQAAPGSTHGYDVVDPTRVNVELGGHDALERLTQTLNAANLGYVLDIVPNHMAITGAENPWWWESVGKRTIQPLRILTSTSSGIRLRAAPRESGAGAYPRRSVWTGVGAGRNPPRLRW